MNTVILITNQETIKQKMQENLVLLRETDKLLSVTYENAPDVLYDIHPDIIILHEHENREKTIGIIKYLKEKRIFSNSNIILLVNEYEKDFVLEAYDEGIDDYLTLKSDPSEILIRTINSIKKSELKTEISRIRNDLCYYGILDVNSDFYTPKFETDIMELELNRIDYSGGSLILLSPDEEGKKVYSREEMVESIKKCIRKSDIVSVSSGAKYSILLQSNIEGAVQIINKLKAELPENLSISAGITAVDCKKYSELKKKAVCALNNAMLTKQGYAVYSNEDLKSENWLEEQNTKQQSYKLYKKAFSKKLENVIAPVFYRLQKAYEEQLSNAQIQQFTDEQQSVFRIICGKNESRLTMLYPGYTKLVTYIAHSGLDSPENREVVIPLPMITQSKIEEIVEGFINEFVGIYRHLYK